ncbi:unnamed protein product [Fraxinus pennsylvanica]|uniref:Uncharacterized protein n=1 Tax=Fraxinus pennsylvanica TaxID=56036 RepID=A0AAD2A4M3_9LAMI|nr:unnamed protein product [Fraxinus pennsylvanica]
MKLDARYSSLVDPNADFPSTIYPVFFPNANADPNASAGASSSGAGHGGASFYNPPFQGDFASQNVFSNSSKDGVRSSSMDAVLGRLKDFFLGVEHDGLKYKLAPENELQALKDTVPAAVHFQLWGDKCGPMEYFIQSEQSSFESRQKRESKKENWGGIVRDKDGKFILHFLISLMIPNRPLAGCD